MGGKFSFYSFKGGSGRSTGLCNVAYALAEAGASVGCVDFDVEAAGLNFIFEVPQGRLDRCKKVQEFLVPDRRRRVDGIEEFVLDLGQTKYEGALDGELYLIPAAIDAELTAELPDEMELMPSIEELFNRYEAEYDLDYLMIDSRSGVSNFAAPTLMQADEVVVFFRWGRQHREGTAAMVPWLRGFVGAFGDADVLAVASNIPESVSDEEIDGFVEDRLEGVRGHEIVYENELLKREEEILTHTDASSSTAREFARVADRLHEAHGD